MVLRWALIIIVSGAISDFAERLIYDSPQGRGVVSEMQPDDFFSIFIGEKAIY